MLWRLGLDMGTNSIGWTALKINKIEAPEIIDMGVRIFQDGREAKAGTPLNEGRRNARQMRRQRDRKIRRKNAMLRFLINNKLMSEDAEERKEIARLDPYELRNAALERKLTPFELGRIMMQFSIRRGFKSSRKEQNSENASEREGMLGGIQSLEDALHGLTLGQWLYRQQRDTGNSVRFRARMEKTKVIYSFYPSREMYEAEFAAIREKQADHYKELNWDRLHWLIFFQRPLKRPERGKCQFYPDEERGYKAFSSAHRFRILQDINNLKYYNDENRLEEIPGALKVTLFEALNTQKTLSFDRVRKLLGEKYSGTFNLEDSKRSGLKGNETSCDFRKTEYFGQVWDTLDIQTQDSIIEKLMIEENESAIRDFLNPFGLTDIQTEHISGYNLQTGTTMLSSRFMIECSDIMLKEQLPYHEAVQRLGFHHSDKAKQIVQHSLPYYGKVLSSSVSGAQGENWIGAEGEHRNSIDEKRYGHIANPTVHIALNQLRKLVNALIRRFDNPGEIILEINRELKLSKTRKDEIFREQAQNQRDNERIKKELADLGLLTISGEDIKKYKLWEELAPEGIARRCPYCGKTISANQLISGSVEIEHILPYSRTLLNTRDNLTVAHRECNQTKKERTPYEAFGTSPQGFDWELIKELTAKLPFRKRKKFYPDAMDSFHEEEGGFLNKQLSDTAYLSKAGKDYLAAICDRDKIWVSTGRLTSMLRGLWGFNTILNRGHDTWFKNRSDHRHHALDSLVIGLCDRGLIAKAAHINSGRGYRELDAPPCPIPRQDIEKRLNSILVSHKPDHGKEGKLYAETALAKRSYIEQISPGELEEKEITRVIPKSIQQAITALVQQQGYKKAKKIIQEKYKYLRVFRDKWVTRSPVESLSDRDIPNICDPVIREKVQHFIDGHPGQKLQDVLSQFSSEMGIHSVRYFPKDQVPLPINSCDNKAYMPGDFYRVDIWKVPLQKGKFKYEGVFISRPEAMRQMLSCDDTSPLRQPHPAAKLVMGLCKNDIVELSNEKEQELCRIAGYATTRNNIDIRPIYASDTITAWRKDTHINLTSSFWPYECDGQYFKSINLLFTEYQVKLVNITVDGRIFYRS